MSIYCNEKFIVFLSKIKIIAEAKCLDYIITTITQAFQEKI